MHILFLYSSLIDPNKGGVQRVTFVLANYFKCYNINVSFLSFDSLNDSVKDSHDFSYFCLPNKQSIYNKENREYLELLIKEQHIDIVINQGAINPEISKLSYIAKKLNVKLISVIHNSIFSKIDNAEITYNYRFKNRGLSFVIPLLKLASTKFLLKKIYLKKYKNHYLKLYNENDRVILLSSQYFNEYHSFFEKKSNFDKLIAIPNPLSFTVTDSNNNKKKNLLYIGRLDFEQKRVDLLLQIWSAIYKDFPDWILDIIGDGKVKEKIVSKIKTDNILRINVLGYQDPQTFYKKASILCLTSSYEGFGLVLVEAMAYGVVPVAFNSYASITDIINDKINGILVNPFNVDEYIGKLKKLMTDENVRKKLSKNAQLKAQQFSVDIVGQQWIKIFNQILSE
ncbi:glycosyl transferase [Bacteroidia bacterium]|nr:glycosyl transferase [Bacteroidia bacterium]